jgi:diguanylate cyclase (GGDEF)-like protein
VADRLRHVIASQTVEFDGARIRYTVSAGVAEMDAGMAGLDALMKRADEALYAAKSAGRNCIETWLPA